MATTQQYFNLVQTGKSSWIAVHVKPSVDETTEGASGPTGLFGRAAASRITLAERFPRLTIAFVALVLFAATLTTEVDLLRGAGFRWQ
ncbi:MAG: hypothetical protein WB608_05415 [Terracidiphilus sp.]